MGRAHGFRIYLVEAFKDRIKDRDPEVVDDGSPAQSVILGLLESLRGTHFIAPRPGTSGEPTPPTRTLSVGAVASIRHDLHHLTVASGERGSHGRAVHETDGEVDLTGRSPEADHYLTVIFPQQGGTKFVIVAHTIRGRDPVALLLRQMTKRSAEQKRAADADSREARRAARAAHERVPPAQTHSRLLFQHVQAVDASYLEDLIGSASKATAEFRTLVPSDRGGRRTRISRALQISLIDPNALAAGRDAALGWAQSFRFGTRKSAREGVAELASLLEDGHLLEEGEADRYGSAAVRVSNRDSPETRIAVDTIRDVFTYPVADDFPPVAFYYSRVEARLPGVLDGERINAAALDAREVTQWLDASTSDR